MGILIGICGGKDLFKAFFAVSQIQKAEQCFECRCAVIIGGIGIFGGSLLGVSGAAHHALLLFGEHMLDALKGFALRGGAYLRYGGAVQILHSSAGDHQSAADVEIIDSVPDKRQFKRAGELTVRKIGIRTAHTISSA